MRVLDDGTIWGSLNSGKARVLWVLGLVVLSGLAAGGAPREQLLEARGKLAEYYGPPYQTRMRWYLEGARVQPLTNDQWLITEPRLQTFSVQGERTLGVQAPQCIMDRRGGTVSSSGPIQAQLAEGKFSISGEGFLWRQTNSDLIISNHVRTLLQPDLLARTSAEAGPAKGKGPVEILSQQFDYSTNYGQAVWRGGVRVKGEQLALSCGVLRAKLPSGQRGLQGLVAPSSGAQGQRQDPPSGQGRLESIAAEQNVSVDYAGVQATGDEAVYTAETDEVHLSGHPTWRAQSREGSADDLVLGRTNQVLRASGNAVLKMPGQGLPTVGLVSPGGPHATNALPAKDQVLEVLSQSYIVQTNLETTLAEFSGPVQVSERAGGEVRGTMSCGQLTVGLGQTNQLERMVAQPHVVIHQQDRQFLAGKAVYEGTNGVMKLTEAPSWQAGLRQGRGDLIWLSTKPEGMLVVGNAWMRLPAEELASAEVVPHGPPRRPAASSAGGTAAGAANRPAAAKPGGTNSPMAVITAEEYTVTPQGAIFEQEAHIEHPRMTWSSQTITVYWPEGGTNRHILAETAVRFELMGENDRKMEGQGDKADYAYSVTNGITNETMVLTGRPARLDVRREPAELTPTANPAQFVPARKPPETKTEQGTVTDALITLDRIHERIRTSTGRQWAIHIETPPVNTNSFQLPKYKPKKKFDERRMGPP
jgi:lipopolysaccharide export system protein LptA